MNVWPTQIFAKEAGVLTLTEASGVSVLKVTSLTPLEGCVLVSIS